MDDRHATPPWSLSLVIPAFNEEAGIAAAIAEADAALAELAADYEILVVDDGSRDATARIVAECSRQRPRVRLLRHPQNRGYGAALRTGFQAARCDLVAFTDADCQFHLVDLARLLPLTAQNPVVVGYRINRQDRPYRRFISWGYNLMARTLLGTRVRDVDCALKVFRREAVQQLAPESRGFFVNTEMLARARQRGYEVAEVGVRHRPRLRGSSTVTLADIPRTLRSLLPFWWSQVLFPRLGGARPAPTRFFSLDPGVCLLMLMALLFFFGRLGCPLQEPQEARYAEIPRQMLAEGRFLVPVLHGQAYLDKPPLLYWLVMASYRVFGVHDWAARLVPGLAGFLGIAVTYAWGRGTVGLRSALIGALILCLSARFVQLERLLTMDGLLCLWVVSALAAAHQALTAIPASGSHAPPARPPLAWKWWLLSAFACALGLLTKGPVTLVLIGVPVLAFALLDPRSARPGWRAWASYLALAVGLAAPWFVAVMLREPGFADYFFWGQNVRRFVAPFDHQQPMWFYLPELLLGMLPWSLLVPALIGFLGWRSPELAARRPQALGFFLLCSLWSLLFFTLSGCKRPGYLLPAVPPLALALGCYLDAILPADECWTTLRALLRSGAPLAFPATALALLMGAGGAIVAILADLIAPATGIVLATLALLALAAVLRLGRRTSWLLCLGATFTVLLTALHLVLPGYARKFSLRGELRRYAAVSGPLVCYPHRWDSVSFYLGRDDVRVFSASQRGELIAELQQRPETLVLVRSEKWVDELRRHLPPELEFVPQGRQGFVTMGWVRPR